MFISGKKAATWIHLIKLGLLFWRCVCPVSSPVGLNNAALWRLSPQCLRRGPKPLTFRGIYGNMCNRHICVSDSFRFFQVLSGQVTESTDDQLVIRSISVKRHFGWIWGENIKKIGRIFEENSYWTVWL